MPLERITTTPSPTSVRHLSAPLSECWWPAGGSGATALGDWLHVADLAQRSGVNTHRFEHGLVRATDVELYLEVADDRFGLGVQRQRLRLAEHLLQLRHVAFGDHETAGAPGEREVLLVRVDAAALCILLEALNCRTEHLKALGL